ncbi:MAG TPA: polysaccharide pyruvyl transferase family protein [Longimicrobiales bacterium]|nr:polysaccharide pyruvyl transferase family protein [Longimicrobiales bacterium]
MASGGGGAAAARSPLIVGYYGMRNAGDNAFCLVLDHALRRYWGTESPLFAAPTLPGLAPEACTLSGRWFTAERTTLRAGRVLGKLAGLRHASMLLFGGGSVFRDMGPLSEKRAFSWWSRMTGKPMAAVGVSVGPFVSVAAERRLGRVLRRIEYLAVRDAASYDRALAAGCRGRLVLAADLAGLLPEAIDVSALRRVADGETPSLRPRLGVTVVGRDPELDDAARRRREDGIIEAVRAVADHDGVDVTVLVFNDHPERGDNAVSRRLAERLPRTGTHRVVTAAEGVGALIAALAQCDACLHVRLHGAIFSYVLGIPFALVPYQPKCDDFLEEIGQPYELRLPRVPATAEVRAVIHRLLSHPSPPSLDREAFAERARRNFTEAPWQVARAAA